MAKARRGIIKDMPNGKGWQPKPVKYSRRVKPAPLLLRRFPWILFGFVICVIVFYFVPAFAETMAGIKDVGLNIGAQEDSQQQKTRAKDMYYVPVSSDEYYKAERIRLNTVKSWQGTEMKEIRYNANKSPWVLNAGYKATSKLGSKFDVIIARETEMGFGLEVGYGSVFNGVHSYVVEGAGEFLIGIDTSGCEWWARVGVE